MRPQLCLIRSGSLLYVINKNVLLFFRTVKNKVKNKKSKRWKWYSRVSRQTTYKYIHILPRKKTILSNFYILDPSCIFTYFPCILLSFYWLLCKRWTNEWVEKYQKWKMSVCFNVLCIAHNATGRASKLDCLITLIFWHTLRLREKWMIVIGKSPADTAEEHGWHMLTREHHMATLPFLCQSLHNLTCQTSTTAWGSWHPPCKPDMVCIRIYHWPTKEISSSRLFMDPVLFMST